MTSRVLLCFSLTVLLACEQVPSADQPITEGKKNRAVQLVSGDWRQQCKTRSSNGSVYGSSDNQLNFSGSVLTIKGQNYSTSDCTGDLVDTMTMYIEFEIPSVSSLGQDVYDLNVVPQKITTTVFDQDRANLYNTVAFCGYTDWTVGVEKDITDKSCLSGPQMGEKIYSIIKITADHLQFGGEPYGENTGKTPELRHKNLSSEIFYRN